MKMKPKTISLKRYWVSFAKHINTICQKECRCHLFISLLRPSYAYAFAFATSLLYLLFSLTSFSFFAFSFYFTLSDLIRGQRIFNLFLDLFGRSFDTDLFWVLASWIRFNSSQHCQCCVFVVIISHIHFFFSFEHSAFLFASMKVRTNLPVSFHWRTT